MVLEFGLSSKLVKRVCQGNFQKRQEFDGCCVVSARYKYLLIYKLTRSRFRIRIYFKGPVKVDKGCRFSIYFLKSGTVTQTLRLFVILILNMVTDRREF